MRLTADARVSPVSVAAVTFCCVGLATAAIGARQSIAADAQGRIWLVLIVLVGLIALGLLGWATDTRRTVRLGVGWAVLGAGIAAIALRNSPGARPGAPLASGWSLLVVAGAAVLLGGVLLAVRPVVSPRVPRLVLPLLVIGVCAVQVAGCWGAVSWTDGQNVRLSVADSAPLRPRTAVLDGRTLWSSQTTGRVLGSAGGLLITLPDGVRMVDPTTGATRWTYQRADVIAVVAPVVSADGTLVAVEAATRGALAGDAAGDIRLLVLRAATGAVLLDTALGAKVVGALSAITDTAAYFSGGPDNTDTVQLTAVDTTGPSAGRARWVFYPGDGCQINRFAAEQSDLVLSTSCGTVTMLGPAGTALWTYRVTKGGAEVWPLVGAPAGTVLVSAQAPVGPADPGFGAPTPRAIIALDARTGTVRWQDTDLPTPPYSATSQDLADGSMTTRWAGNEAVLAYYLPVSRRVWLVGIDPANRSTWAITVPGMYFAIQPGQGIGDFLAVLPDGRILLPSQPATNDVLAQPTVTVIDGRTGVEGPTVAVDNPYRATGYQPAPAAVGTPAGVVLDMAGASLAVSSPNSLLVGLH